MEVLPTPGGPTRQMICPLTSGVQLAHGQQLQNALLDLLQTVVVTVQHLAGVGLVKVVLGGGVPRQGQAGIQIAADNAALGAAARHTGQTVALFQQLFGGLLHQGSGALTLLRYVSASARVSSASPSSSLMTCICSRR